VVSAALVECEKQRGFMKQNEMVNEVKSVLAELDNLANVWGGEGVFRRCRDRLRKIAEHKCDHANSSVEREGMIGVVRCHDCEYERDWGAY